MIVSKVLSRAKSLFSIKSLRWNLRLFFPNAFLSAGEKRSFAESDKKSNAGTTPDASEEVALEIFYGAEIYGPAEADRLYKNLTRLKWSAGHGGIERKNAADWVREQRLYGDGGWYNVGVVVRADDTKRFLLPSNTLELPKGVDFLKVEITQLTAALTCVVVGFVMDSSFKHSYAAALCKEYRARFVRGSKRTLMRKSPSDYKRYAIEAARQEARSLVLHWFSKNLPGYFCSNGPLYLPTAELVSTQVTPIFQENFHSEGWREMIVSYSRYGVWGPSSSGGVKMSHFSLPKLEGSFHLVFGVCRSEVDAEEIRYFGDPASAYKAYASEFVPEVLSHFASIGYLSECLKRTKLSRSSLRLAGVVGKEQIRVLEKIQVFFDSSLSAPVLASELKAMAGSPANFLFRHGDFKAPGWRGNDTERSLASFLAAVTTERSQRLLFEEHSLREHFEQLANIISIRESLRAQRKSEWITLLALLIATASMVITALQSRAWVLELKNFFEGLFTN